MNNFMGLDEWMRKNFSENAAEAAAYLRLALAEAVEDPEGLILAFQQVARARGGIDDLDLSLEEKAALASALSRSLAATSFPQAA